MRKVCISNRYCQYRSDTGYCGYTACGCALDNTATIEVPNMPIYRITQLVDISPESIEEIANAVVERVREVDK